MARYNTSFAKGIISESTVISSPYTGAFTELTGLTPYVVVIPDPVLFPGSNQTFYNSSSVNITIQTPTGLFKGTGGTNTNLVVIPPSNVVSVTSTGADYIVISEDGSPLVATTGLFSSDVTVNGSTATVNISPSVLTINPSSNTSSMNNVKIGENTKQSGGFTSLTATGQVTLSGNIASTTTGTGTAVITGGLGVSGNINSGGTVTATALSGPLTGTIQTAAQPNITSVGTLTGLGVSGSSTVTINTGTTLPLKLTTSSAGPWAIALERSDTAFTSQVYNDGTGWYFQHRPSFVGNTPLDSNNYTSYALTSSGIVNNTDTYCNFRVIRNSNSSSSNDGMYIGYANSNSGVTRIFGGGATSGEFIKYSSYSSDSGSFRAPIFYDSNNTGYYIDPTSTTSIRTAGDWRSDASGWTGEFSGKIQYHANHWYFQSADLWIFRNSGGSNVFYVNQSGHTYAPILYDSDNSAYYCDPASTSVLGTVKFASGVSLYYGNNSRNLYFKGGDGTDVGLSIFDSAGTHRIQIYGAGSDYGFLNGNWASWDLRKTKGGGLYLNNQSTYYISGTEIYYDRIYGTADIRSPIFYDNNNTGYYVDAASGSQFAQVYANDWFRPQNDCGIYWQQKGRGIRDASSEGNSYGNVSTYGGGVNGWQGYSISSNLSFMGRGGTDIGIYSQGFNWGFYMTYAGLIALGSSTTSASYRVYLTGSAYSTGSWISGSDVRTKENIITVNDALNKVIKLRGVYFNKKESQNPDGKKPRELGVIAQEINEVIPEVVTYAEDRDEFSVSYGNLAGLFIEAFKDLNLELTNLKNEIKLLKG